MLTYQDLQRVTDSDQERAEFVRSVIWQHRASDLYKTAKFADDYDRCQNTTITQYEKMLTTITGELVPDRWSPTHRSASNFFNIFTTQLNQYLLGNGAEWGNDDTGDKLGKDFDTRLQQLGKNALCGGVGFGYWNFDKLEVFSVLEFAPLYDEENGALSAGVRFWQIDIDKPLRATLYELDGLTNYYWQDDADATPPVGNWQRIEDGVYMQPKRTYKLKTRQSAAEGVEIYDGENYPGFPIIPLWGNPRHQSELVGLREKIDAYDMILNGFEDDLDNAQIYWIIKGAGGMDDPDLVRFLDRLRTVKAAAPADGQEVSPVQVEIPYSARESLLTRLEKQLYRDAMIMNPDDLASGATTATQIRAAYERQNVKADQFEYCVLDFLDGLLEIVGIDDDASFTRSTIVNTQEEIQTVIMAAQFVGEEYTTRKILKLLGDGDQIDDVLEAKEKELQEKMGMLQAAQDDTGAE